MVSRGSYEKTSLLGLFDQKVLGKRRVLERDNVMTAWPFITEVSKAVGVRTGTLHRLRVDANAYGGAQGTEPDMRQCRKEGSRAFPGGWETGASTSRWLGNERAWNWVLNCAAHNLC